MNEDNQEIRPDDEEPVVVVVDTLDRTERQVKRRRIPELDRWVDLFNQS